MDPAREQLSSISLVEALRDRRSRRFGAGMRIPSGPFAYSSDQPPQPLSEEEEAALVYAAAGITGYALADLSFGPEQGGTMVAALVGRTVSSADAIQNVALVVTNDEATYLIKRPADLSPGDVAEVIAQSQAGELTTIYRRLRTTIREGRTAPPLTPPINFTVNHWSLYAPGGTYFLPIADVTRFYINGVMEMLDEGMDLFIVDERASFRPAGLRQFGKSRGGPLHDNPQDQRMGTVAQVETVIAEMLAIEIGMMLQNLHLMAQAIGLGGWPNFARHDSGWFRALGFRMATMPSSKYLGFGPTLAWLARTLRRDIEVDYPLALEVNGEPLLTPYCPPFYPSMRDAVFAVAEEKFGADGIWRGGGVHSAWREPAAVTEKIPRPNESVIEATAAYCQYLYDTYGRFPVYLAPYRTVLGSQVTHVDTAFYDRFFRPEVLSPTQREHQRRWHHTTSSSEQREPLATPDHPS
ncbi:MAG: hypothetical protein KatS3mg060_1928 [Dehalococcoidia bacterium]|nr:MAG: hypothetical protein KatS3mg060_1928 [Dehalococcoidia bacterium]